jgi:hypothetical protein
MFIGCSAEALILSTTCIVSLARIPYLHLTDYRMAPFQMPEERSTFLSASTV